MGGRGKMRRLLILMLLLLVGILGACGEDGEKGSSSKGESKAATEPKGVVEEKDFDKMYTDPKKYKNYEVEFIGKVFVDPERDEDGVYLQVWADGENSEKNLIVAYNEPDFEVSTDDYIRVKGIVGDSFEGENAFGASMEMPAIKASKIEAVDYMTAVAPTIKTIEVNEEINQNGFIVSVEKIEIAENETRVYAKVDNQTKDNISFYSFSTKLIVGNKQLEEENVYEADYPELQSDLIPGTQTEGIIVYPKIDENEEMLKFYAEGSSDNYEITVEPFTFEIPNK